MAAALLGGLHVGPDDDGGLPFTNWTEPMLVLTPDQRDDDMAVERLEGARPLLRRQHPDDYRCEFYGLVVWRSGDTFLGMLWVYKTRRSS